MTQDQTRVANLIREAFQGVVLGNGVGLFQGQAMDDYASEAHQKEEREKDEKTDWASIPFENLNRCHSSLSFFDAEGMRFHLPAFLVSDLEGTFKQEIMFTLLQAPRDTQATFTLLNSAQREAIGDYLLLQKDEMDEADKNRLGPRIDRAVKNYWKLNP